LKESVEIERSGDHRKPSFRASRPSVGRSVPIKLCSVAVRIAKIYRFTDPVIGRAVERKPSA
jgi:hypothetical protein